MTGIHPRAGTQSLAEDLINLDTLVGHYYDIKPDLNDASQLVIFGTSGHRGSASKSTFNECHLLAIAQAIVDIRKKYHITGPCFVGKDSHILSEPALKSLLEVFAANQVMTVIAQDNGYTPTPVISHAIITYNQQHKTQVADGVVITPSHNPPEDGGIKYNVTHGGPADTDITKEIEFRANELLRGELREIKRLPLSQALHSGYVHEKAFEKGYIDDLANVIDMKAIADSTVKMGVDPLGGAAVSYWPRIAEQYQLNLNIVNDKVDAAFGFMHLDHDGAIRMDCSSAHAMAGLIKLKDQFDLAFGNDTDADRHGIVTPSGLMNPNAYLSAVTDYLLQYRPDWHKSIMIGKTLVTSSMIDRVTTALGHQYQEFPVGFKWYAEGLFNGTLGFACEESAGGSLLRHNGQVWTTDKDGLVLCLLAAEMMAKTDNNPQQQYDRLTDKFGTSFYGRIQAPATFAEKQKLAKLDAKQLKTDTLAGESIKQALTTAPANSAPIGGLKVITENGWFAARPSGTEDAYKIYAESFISQNHLAQLQEEAQQLVSGVIK
ncbi:phosphoglucomutase (alpha-D-glucose-1,6-bisphosphate-dependent) [Utexia brackfieldae]|uniref:phosphoglucomutase (alpha-D-glucose-1,6-bisphosphate-dependent) n=1 Tax=Utexia brackfieldae TaxID=3074108 RepID=UPI00370D9880